MKKAIFFDLDGTLLDSIGDLRTAVNLTRASYGAGPLALEEVRSCIGDGVRLLVERVLEGVPHDPEEALQRQLKNYEAHFLDTTGLYPGVAEGLKRMKEAGWLVALVTNKQESAARFLLDKLAVLPYFDGIIGGEGKYPLKPDPAGCLALLNEFGVKPADAVMVGDHYADLEVGRRAGMRRVLALWGFGEPRGEKWDYAAPDFPALTNWLLK
ncbi:MAG: HAD-IA family hydrolase [Lentisphaeria bacterium]|nr:HAD-IA family hydrolase [Lentisphaeria bacterium]